MVRVRRGWRQTDVAAAAHISRATVSRLERGHLSTMPLDLIRAACAALDVRVELSPRWRGGELSRLADQGHAALGESVTRRLSGDGWTVRPEMSFSHFGERGSVDLLTWHSPTRTLLVVELKTILTDLQDLVSTVDRKVRLAGWIAEPLGWQPLSVAALVVVAENRTNRRRVAAHRSLLGAAFPHDGRALAGWLRDPSRGFSEQPRFLAFWPNALRGNARPPSGGRQRVRRLKPGP